MTERSEGRWLLLIHQIPLKPAYFRVKIWRRIQGLGAVAIKNSVYVLPKNEETLEDFQWVLREIVQGGGEASICTADFIEGLTDEQIETLFQTTRNTDYAQIAEEARSVLDSVPASASAITDEDKTGIEANLSHLKKRFSSVTALDFFAAPGREPAETLIEQLEARLKEARSKTGINEAETENSDLGDLRGRTWVTRKGVYVDRIACAWLIRRFIDPDAQFKFVSGKGYRPRAGELRFDMFEGEFTHVGDLCSFEVLIKRFFQEDQALVHIGKVIHDLDYKDAKFKKSETAGIGGLLNGLASAHKSDETRLERGSAIFDDLYEYFRRK
ncbi:MAG: chromate resistance protein ChrB domain-containing protein [Desulfomonilaceae bacterium]